MDYFACGDVSLDSTESRDGTLSSPALGGPAFYALAGLRVFTEKCGIICRAGDDFSAYFGGWMSRHGQSREFVSVAAEHCVQRVVKNGESRIVEPSSSFGAGHAGYLRVTPELIDEGADYDTKGICICQNEDNVFWRKLYDIKTRKGFKVLWEDDASIKFEKPREKWLRVQNVFNMVDLWSVHIDEAARMMGISRRNEQDIVNEMIKLPLELSLLRMDANGLWVVTPSGAVHIETVGTGNSPACGHAASAAALYAHCEGFRPAMVGVMAGVAAGYISVPEGVPPHITAAMMRDAREQSELHYKKTTGRLK